MNMNIKTNNSTATTTSNTVRKAFTGFAKPQILAEGEHPAVITAIEQVTGTDSKNKPLDQIEMTVLVDGQANGLKRIYNMAENGRGAAQLINDYNTLFGTSHSRNERYKLECDKLVNLPVVAVVAHNNATKEPTPVLRELKPAVQPEVAVAA